MKDPSDRVVITQTIYKLKLHCADKVVRDKKGHQKIKEEGSKSG